MAIQLTNQSAQPTKRFPSHITSPMDKGGVLDAPDAPDALDAHPSIPFPCPLPFPPRPNRHNLWLCRAVNARGCRLPESGLKGPLCTWPRKFQNDMACIIIIFSEWHRSNRSTGMVWLPLPDSDVGPHEIQLETRNAFRFSTQQGQQAMEIITVSHNDWAGLVGLAMAWRWL